MNRVLLLVVLAVTLGVAGGVLWFGDAVGWDRTNPQTPTTVIVPSGATGHEVARLLERQRVVSSAFAFELLARLRGRQNQMKAGRFDFDPHLSASAVLAQIVSGSGQTATWVTIPEGYTQLQIARTLAAHGFGEEGTLASTFARGSLAFGTMRTRSLEGYLFPDTYLVPTHASPGEIVRIMTGRFRSVLPSDAAARAARLHVTIPQAVTLASLVEREAKRDAERPLIAGVYYNRLQRGMPLQVDATLEYVLPEHKTVLTRADVARDTPYNTYLHGGLPPTPIANPGLSSLQAALRPQASDYLYYVYKGDGRHAFARTLAEHDANVARYLR